MKAQTLFAFIGSITLLWCGATRASDLHTSVSGNNIADVTRDVAEWHDAKHSECKFARVISAEVVKREDKSATEHWTIQACNEQQFTYQVYVIFGDGAITDMVSDVKNIVASDNTN